MLVLFLGLVLFLRGFFFGSKLFNGKRWFVVPMV